MTHDAPTLKRSIGLTALIFYGVGTMVGGGFYALMGKIAGEAGTLAPVALGVSGLLALLNAFAFAEFSARFPVSAGEARYVEEGFGKVWLSTLVGVMVAITGVVSAAALSTATAGFIQDLYTVNHTLTIVVVVLALGAVAAWGIGQSTAVVATITLIEVAALVFVIATNAGNASFDAFDGAIDQLGGMNLALVGIFSGAFLGFYAFVGFEDMVNLAEEVKRPQRTLPIAILVSVVIATSLYVAVSFIAVSTIDTARLRDSRTPIAELMGTSNIVGKRGIVLVSILTGVNGALVQIIMASRVLYGLANRRRLPGWLARVNARTRTPLRTTSIITGTILLLAVLFPLTHLAKVTSAVILMVFAMVNLSLWVYRGRQTEVVPDVPRYPRWLPLIGFLTCVAVLIAKAWLLLSPR